MVLELDVQPLSEDGAQTREVAARRIAFAGARGPRQQPLGAPGEADDAFGVLAHEIEREARHGLFAGELAAADEAAEARPAGVVLREQDEMVAVDEAELGAEDGVKPALLRVLPETDGPVEAVRIGERERAESARERRVDEVLGMRGAVEERVVAVRVQLGVRHNARMPLASRTIAFIGGGTMAEAMIRGLLQRRLVEPAAIAVTGPRGARRDELAATFGVRGVASNVEAARASDVVVLSVKPQVLPIVLRELEGSIRKDALVISIVAGVSSRTG